MEKWKQDAWKIPCLTDDLENDLSLKEVVETAEYVLPMYYDEGTTYYEDLHYYDNNIKDIEQYCSAYKINDAKEMKKKAQLEIRRLKAFIKKYRASI